MATRTSAGAWMSYHSDHLGSVALATTNGALVSQQEFDPWGAVRAGGVTQTSLPKRS